MSLVGQTEKNQYEHMFSVLPLIADIGAGTCTMNATSPMASLRRVLVDSKVQR
jgi:hypothetical protein